MSLLNSITIETSISPPIMVYGGKPSKFAQFLLGILKPKVTVNSALGDTVQTPYGVPDADMRPWILGAVVLILGVMVWR